jgi:hypothetical protein
MLIALNSGLFHCSVGVFDKLSQDTVKTGQFSGAPLMRKPQ